VEHDAVTAGGAFVELSLGGPAPMRIGPVGGAAFIARCSVREAISELVEAHVEVGSLENVDFAPALAEPATLVLGARGEERRFGLGLAGARFLGVRDGALRYALELFDPSFRLGLTTQTRKYRGRSVQDIVTEVLGAHGIACEWRLERPLAVRPYVVQYRETDLAFVRRLLEREGVFHTVDEAGGLVFGDQSTGAPRVTPTSRFELMEAGGALARGEPGIHALTRRVRVGPGAVTVDDHDWKRPGLSLRAGASAARDAALEVYEHPAGYRDPEEGARLARLRLEALRARADEVSGESDVLGLAPLRAFTFGAWAGAALAGDYLLVDVEHRFDPRGEGATYTNRFAAIPLEVPFRPALRTPAPRVAGTHTAIVTGPEGSEIHTDAHGRFRARFHWDREATGTDDDSRWVRMLQETASSMTLARVGWEVAIAYLWGDPERPVGLARHINGAMPPTFALPKAKAVMAMRTPSSPASGGYSELRLDDAAGSMGIHLRAERDLVGLVKNDRTERVGQRSRHFVGAELTQVVERDQVVTVGASSRVEAGASAALTVGLDRDVVVGARESIEVGTSATSTVGGDERERVGGARVTIAGSAGGAAAAMTLGAKGAAKGAVIAGLGATFGGGGAAGAASAAKGAVSGTLAQGVSITGAAGLVTRGSIARSGERGVRRTVGGAFVSVTAASASNDVGRGYAEIVGGARLAVAGQDIAQEVAGPLVIQVGGASIHVSTGDMSASAKVIRVQAGAAIELASRVEIRVEAPTVKLEAGQGLKLASGAATLELAPGGAILEGPTALAAPDKITVHGGTIDLTKG
jgi:type VI secretion system secreted protein VgrG